MKTTKTHVGNLAHAAQRELPQDALATFEAIIKDFTDDEKKVARLIKDCILRGGRLSHEDHIAGLKNNAKELDKVLRLKVFELLNPFASFLMRVAAQTPNELVLDRLKFIGDCQPRVQDYLNHLDSETKLGVINALRELAFLAHEATRRLEEWSTNYPEFTAFVAREYSSWPLLAAASKHKLLRKLDLLKNIRLNEDRPDVTPAAKVAIDPTPPQRWAILLLRHLELLRLSRQPDSWDGLFPKVIKADWKMIRQEEINRIRQRTAALPPFSYKSVAAWWKLAQPLFLGMTNNQPWNEKDLKPYANSAKIDPGAPWKKIDGIRRSNVLKHIRQAFFDLAEYAE